ncbi:MULTISPECIES: alpha/beta hydrolase [unclassified Beijerinckia]|uniref:alpha/beta fold hydrolase n=1 Tax=unclassified Beijerinckia TaxID=2638183 RepID=UPI00089A5710|nr:MULTISPECIES: alpha/beta hydrolase [unclassified Beijerinckia]MDH7796321.1 pimeloyl-ACP methyl ester carboxylesterase [Beijerinckia sp. GAS462]SEC39983.1 Pimeloyl-ACP methyl ester carboxylesterase [Beijerinckia sp. 28-YEA-48]
MSRQTLVLIPGMLNNATVWSEVAPALTDVADVHIPIFSDENTIEAMAETVLASAPPGPLAIAGFSMGGWVAQAVFRQAKDRTTRLAFISSGASPADQKELDTFTRTGNSVPSNFEALLARMFPATVHPSRLEDTALAATAIQMWREVGPITFVQQRQAVVDRPDLRPHLRALDIPVLIACGREDPVCPPAFSQELGALMPSAHIVFVEQCGHLLPFERPDELAGLMRQWLAAKQGITQGERHG